VQRGHTLKGVERLSEGRFKASVVGGYERAERAISVSRFCEIAALYDVAAPDLLAQALTNLPVPATEDMIVRLDEPERELRT
jgi:hypothetical protein